MTCCSGYCTGQTPSWEVTWECCKSMDAASPNIDVCQRTFVLSIDVRPNIDFCQRTFVLSIDVDLICIPFDTAPAAELVRRRTWPDPRSIRISQENCRRNRCCRNAKCISHAIANGSCGASILLQDFRVPTLRISMNLGRQQAVIFETVDRRARSGPTISQDV